MVLPMGALAIRSALSACCHVRQRHFWHRLAVRRAVADGHDADCLTRFAGGGGGDDRPGDAGRDPQHFAEASQRNMALGWAAVGFGGGFFARWWAVSCWSISHWGRCS